MGLEYHVVSEFLHRHHKIVWNRIPPTQRIQIKQKPGQFIKVSLYLIINGGALYHYMQLRLNYKVTWKKGKELNWTNKRPLKIKLKGDNPVFNPKRNMRGWGWGLKWGRDANIGFSQTMASPMIWYLDLHGEHLDPWLNNVIQWNWGK